MANRLRHLFWLSSIHSQEEIESLRERMQAQTSLVVVGSADDALRVGKTKRQIEGVTQAMVDNMIIDEVSEFAATCIINPPAPRDLNAEQAANAKLTNGPPCSAGGHRGHGNVSVASSSAASAAATAAAATAASGAQKKRKGSVCLDGTEPVVKAPKTCRTTVGKCIGRWGRAFQIQWRTVRRVECYFNHFVYLFFSGSAVCVRFVCMCVIVRCGGCRFWPPMRSDAQCSMGPGSNTQTKTEHATTNTSPGRRRCETGAQRYLFSFVFVTVC